MPKLTKEKIINYLANLLEPEEDIDTRWFPLMAEAYMNKTPLEDITDSKMGKIPANHLSGFPLSIKENLDLTFKPNLNLALREWETQETIAMIIGEKTYNTYMDTHGVQRFVPNMIIKKLVDNHTIDLNRLTIAYQNDEFTTDEYLDIITSIGYSVGGFCDLWEFRHLTIINPLWA